MPVVSTEIPSGSFVFIFWTYDIYNCLTFLVFLYACLFVSICCACFNWLLIICLLSLVSVALIVAIGVSYLRGALYGVRIMTFSCLEYRGVLDTRCLLVSEFCCVFLLRERLPHICISIAYLICLWLLLHVPM